MVSCRLRRPRRVQGMPLLICLAQGNEPPVQRRAGTDRERTTARRGASPMNGAMPGLSRRAAIIVSGGSALGAAMSLAGCATRPTVDPAFLRQSVAYETKEAAGAIVVDPANHFGIPGFLKFALGTLDTKMFPKKASFSETI